MEEKSILKDRFQALLDHYNISVKDLSEKIGGSKATYFNIKNGSTQPDFKTSAAILNGFPEISAEWWTRGSGPMLKTEIMSKEEAEAILAENRAIKAMYKAELLGKTKGATLCPDRTREVRKHEFKDTMKSLRGKRTIKVMSSRVQGATIPNVLSDLFRDVKVNG